MDVRWIDQATGDECDVGSMSLVGSVDGAAPVCPVDVILKHSDTPDVVLTHNYRHTQPKESQYYNIHEQSIK